MYHILSWLARTTMGIVKAVEAAEILATVETINEEKNFQYCFEALLSIKIDLFIAVGSKGLFSPLSTWHNWIHKGASPYFIMVPDLLLRPIPASPPQRSSMCATN